MSSPYIGEIRMFGGSFAPAGWAFCAGQLMPISQNDALFNLIGTTYGGNGEDTFALPDLQGRMPVHAGTGSSGTTYQIGEKAGTETVTLTTQQMPVHNHVFLANSATATSPTPQDNIAAVNTQNQYAVSATPTAMNAAMLGASGGSQPHENMMPYLVVSFILSLFGIFPSQN
jgi:microcystin-dependent protein